MNITHLVRFSIKNGDCPTRFLITWDYLCGADGHGIRVETCMRFPGDVPPPRQPPRGLLEMWNLSAISSSCFSCFFRRSHGSSSIYGFMIFMMHGFIRCSCMHHFIWFSQDARPRAAAESRDRSCTAFASCAGGARSKRSQAPWPARLTQSVGGACGQRRPRAALGAGDSDPFDGLWAPDAEAGSGLVLENQLVAACWIKMDQ